MRCYDLIDPNNKQEEQDKELLKKEPEFYPTEVAYKNEFNFTQFKGMNANELNCTFVILTEIKQTGDRFFSIPIEKFQKAGVQAGRSKKRLLKFLTKLQDSILSAKQLSIVTEGNDKVLQLSKINVFSFATLDIENNTFEGAVNVDYIDQLNDFKDSAYTVFDSQDAIQLKTAYAKNLYRLLMQFSSTGEYYVRCDLLMNLLDCPPSFRDKPGLFRSNVIKPAVKEINNGENEIMNLKDDIKMKNGKITSFKFSFKPVLRLNNKVKEKIGEPKKQPRNKDIEKEKTSDENPEKKIVVRSTLLDDDDILELSDVILMGQSDKENEWWN